MAALHSLYISTGNNVINYFRSAANRTKAKIFWSCSGHDSSIIAIPILKRFTVLETVIQGLYFFCCNLLGICTPWPRKWGSSGPTVVHALHKRLILICSETANASIFKIWYDIALDSTYISTGNDVTSYFRSAENGINVFILGHVRVAISR